mmetsp:Transcript_50132/g.75530  ORF Transcript_50132/g.75530 Transcript_50132/m.75530 type:complete len:87 (-) Transcript_50132:1031-1291(-)
MMIPSKFLVYTSSSQLVSFLDNVAKIELGGDHSCGIDNNGRVWCWGENSSGQLGLGGTTYDSVPTQLSSIYDVTDLALGGSHFLRH